MRVRACAREKDRRACREIRGYKRYGAREVLSLSFSFSPSLSYSSSLSLSLSLFLVLSPSLSHTLAPSRRKKKGENKSPTKRNAGSLTARRRCRAMAACLCPVLLVHSARVTGATTTTTTTTTTTIGTSPAVTTTKTKTTTTTTMTRTTSTTEVVPAAARRPLDEKQWVYARSARDSTSRIHHRHRRAATAGPTAAGKSVDEIREVRVPRPLNLVINRTTPDVGPVKRWRREKRKKTGSVVFSASNERPSSGIGLTGSAGRRSFEKRIFSGVKFMVYEIDCKKNRDSKN